jgi:hypothetical protein
MTLGKRAAAEFFAIPWLVFGGRGAAILDAAFPHLGIGFLCLASSRLSGSPLVIGGALDGVIYVIGRTGLSGEPGVRDRAENGGSHLGIVGRRGHDAAFLRAGGSQFFTMCTSVPPFSK